MLCIIKIKKEKKCNSKTIQVIKCMDDILIGVISTDRPNNEALRDPDFSSSLVVVEIFKLFECVEVVVSPLVLLSLLVVLSILFVDSLVAPVTTIAALVIIVDS